MLMGLIWLIQYSVCDLSVSCFNKLITKLAGMIRRLMKGWKPAV